MQKYNIAFNYTQFISSLTAQDTPKSIILCHRVHLQCRWADEAEKLGRENRKLYFEGPTDFNEFQLRIPVICFGQVLRDNGKTYFVAYQPVGSGNRHGWGHKSPILEKAYSRMQSVSGN